MINKHVAELGYPVKWTYAPNSGCGERKLKLQPWQTDLRRYITHATGRGKNKQKVITFCAVRGGGAKTGVHTVRCSRPAAKTALKLLWHSWCLPLHVSKPSWMDLWNRTTATDEFINTGWDDRTVYAFRPRGVNSPAGLDSMYRCEVVIPYKTTSPDWNEAETTLLYSTDTLETDFKPWQSRQTLATPQ